MSDPLSCLPGQPLINFGSGTAPTLDYNLPQKSVLGFWHSVEFEDEDLMNPTRFKDSYTDVPEDDWWEFTKNLTANQIKSLILQEIETGIPITNNAGNTFRILEGLDVMKDNLGAKGTISIVDELGTGAGAYYIKQGVPYKNLIYVGSGNSNVLTQFVDDTTRNQLLSTGRSGWFIEFAPLAATNRHTLLDIQVLVGKIQNGLRPVFSLDNQQMPFISYLEKPIILPRIFILTEVKVASYLGNYGAGKTVQTFSLLPGEKTTISVRTYQNSESTRQQAQNALESANNQTSAEIQSLVEEETSYSKSTSKGGTASTNWYVAASVSAGVNVGIVSAKASVSGGGGGTNTASYNQSVNQGANSINSAMDKHVNNSNSTRQVEVNTTSTETVRQGSENSMVRELFNPNLSRTLNFVFRQLQQEYVVLNYVSNIKFLVANGKLEHSKVLDISELNRMLDTIMQTTDYANSLMNGIVNMCCTVINFDGSPFSMFEEKDDVAYNCATGTPTDDGLIWARKKNLDYYPPLSIPDVDVSLATGRIAVPGPILGTTSHILKTDSVIVDSLLGQGDALDCFNAQTQNEGVKAAQWENQRKEKEIEMMEKQIEILEVLKTKIDAMTDGKEAAEAYRKVFNMNNSETDLGVNLDVNTNTP